MKTIVKSAIKILGLMLLLQAINGLALVGSFLLTGDQIGFYFFLVQILGILVYLVFSVLFLVTPNWMLRPFGVLSDEKSFVVGLDKTTLGLGIILLGFYFIVDSGTSILSFIARLIVRLGTHDALLSQIVEKELTIQIGRMGSLVAGLLMVFRSQSIVGTIWRKELAEPEDSEPKTLNAR